MNHHSVIDPDTGPDRDAVPASRGRTASSRGSLWRSRWAAIGAAVAVTLGGGTLHMASAADSEPSSIISVTPTRILDTRDPTDLGLPGPFVSAEGQELQVTGPVSTLAGTQTVVPTGATGVLLNVTVVDPTARGFISVRPAGTPGPPDTSNLNFEAGDVTPNAVFVALPTDGPDAGRIEITYDAYGSAGPTTDILGDVVGYTMELPAVVDIDAYTRDEADALFLTGDDVYTRDEADALFLTGDDVYTRDEADAAFGSLFAVVSVDGELDRSSGGVVDANQTGEGLYEVIFDRDISACAYQVTAGSDDATDPTPPRFAMVGNLIDNPDNGVAVFISDFNGEYANLGFHLTVHC